MRSSRPGALVVLVALVAVVVALVLAVTLLPSLRDGGSEDGDGPDAPAAWPQSPAPGTEPRAGAQAGGASPDMRPAGARRITDCGDPRSWESENGGYLDVLPETGPSGEPVLRSTLVDGQTVAGQGPVERNDLQGADVPLGSVRWMVWNERFVEMPQTDLDRWQLIGPNEIHGITLPQATVMPEVSPDGRRRLNANAGLPETRYFDLGRIVPGQWHQYMFGVHYTEGGDGWLEMWRDGRLMARVDGPTTSESVAGYWKFGHYRSAAIEGRSVYDVSGCTIYAG